MTQEQTTSEDRKWREVTLEEGDVWDKEKPLEGRLLRTEENIGPKKSKLHVIGTENGEVKAWGSIVLNDKLLGVPTGAYVRIEYDGMKQSKTGSEYHNYKVFVDDNSLDGELPPELSR